MNKHYIKLAIIGLFLSLSSALFSQTGYISINLNGTASSNPVILDLSDVSNAHLGFLMPNVNLASTSDVTTISGPVVGTIIWNTNAALPLGVGYYYWSGTAWLYVNNSGSSSSLTGAGTANYLARWTSAANLGTGVAQDNGTGVSISSTALTPVNKLDVNGNAAFGTYAGTVAAPSGGIIVSGRTGIGTNAPNANAALDVTSTTGGLLPPRMNTGQMTGIIAPAIGLIVFNTTTNCLDYWSGLAWQPVVCPCAGAPATPGAITGSTTPCASSGGNSYSITAVANANYYVWTLPTGAIITAGTGTNAITVLMGTASGTISVTAGNSCGISAASTLAVTATAIPATPGSITGSGSPCSSSLGNTYTIAAVAGATSYNWTVPAGATITANTGTSITVTMGSTSGNITVTATNACGTSAASSFPVTLNNIPAAPATITGPATPCASSAGNVYSITAVAGATTYTWTLPAGATITAGNNTNSITVTWATTSGNITVTAGNACGNSTASPALAITLNAPPATPGAITGTTSYCNQYSTAGHVYSIAAVANASSYTWVVPAGVGTIIGSNTGTSITVTLAGSYGTGNITVTATNACGTSAAQSLAVTNNGTPVAPGAITGTTSPATSSPNVYTIAAMANATSYTWTSSNTNLGAVTAGGSTTSATITTTSTTGTFTICVSATNGCGGPGPTTCLTVTSTGCAHGSISKVYTGALQTWVVPACITTVTIVAAGASGQPSGLYSGGNGAVVTATVTVVGGATLDIVCGAAGQSEYADYSGGGGGGSFVWSTSSTTYPLVVAGGGGGGGNSSNGSPGSTTLTPTPPTVGGAGGAGGLGGAAGAATKTGPGGGGGGWIGNGGNGAAPLTGGQGGKDYAGALAGGASNTDEPVSAGGFGGGGGGGYNTTSTWGGGGGGGGYNGGGGGTASTNALQYGGGGGGSGYYNGAAFVAPVSVTQTNSGGTTTWSQGYVTITW